MYNIEVILGVLIGSLSVVEGVTASLSVFNDLRASFVPLSSIEGVLSSDELKGSLSEAGGPVATIQEVEED